MYRGKKKKLLHNSGKFKAVSIDDKLYLQVNPLFKTSVLFIEKEEGTEVVFLHNDKLIESFIHPFIKPSQIIDKGRIIADKDKDYFKEILKNHIGIDFYTDEEYKNLNSVEKTFYVDKTWDLSHTLVYDLY